MLNVGTPYFVSEQAAVRYYLPYCPKAQVLQKLAAKEIYIGKPGLKPGESLSLNSEGRYVIHAEVTHD